MQDNRKSLDERQQATDLQRLRHSCAHVMATAILRIWPQAQLATGPAIDRGFYYDLELDYRISPDDFEKIEAEMLKVVKENQTFEKRIVSRQEAVNLAKSGRLSALKERETPSKFKLDLISEIPENEEISIYENGDFWDLCAGSHVLRTGNCKAFKLMSVSSAFYKGDHTKGQLQRLYGTCFKNKTLLMEYLERLEQAQLRDHRKIGKEMDLFLLDPEVGQGLVMWTPKGTIIRQELQKFISQYLDEQGYKQVVTPHIGKLSLYQRSGHFPHYEENQFTPIVGKEALENLANEGCSCSELMNHLRNGEVEGYLLKPMNCPYHIKLYASQPRSYRDLPIRLAEFGTVYRWEKSGELGGMTRVRGFTQDDAHLFCSPDQLGSEIELCLSLVEKVLSTLGIKDYWVRLSLRDLESDKYVGDDHNWLKAEDALRKAVKLKGIRVIEALGEAAFYGPKVDFVIKDAIGREWQLGTVQVDYNLPQRFGLTFTGSDNQLHQPIMIHRAPFGSLERFVGLLIEHFKGNFPLWLAPEQARILPISDKFLAIAQKVHYTLKARGIRVDIDAKSEKIGARIRRARLDRVVYILVVGEQEEANGTVSVRRRGEEQSTTLLIEDVVKEIVVKVEEKS